VIFNTLGYKPKSSEIYRMCWS